MTKEALEKIRAWLEYNLLTAEDEHGYDRETFFADREIELQGLIIAIDKELAKP